MILFESSHFPFTVLVAVEFVRPTTAVVMTLFSNWWGEWLVFQRTKAPCITQPQVHGNLTNVKPPQTLFRTATSNGHQLRCSCLLGCHHQWILRCKKICSILFSKLGTLLQGDDCVCACACVCVWSADISWCQKLIFSVWSLLSQVHQLDEERRSLRWSRRTWFQRVGAQSFVWVDKQGGNQQDFMQRHRCCSRMQNAFHDERSSRVNLTNQLIIFHSTFILSVTIWLFSDIHLGWKIFFLILCELLLLMMWCGMWWFWLFRYGSGEGGAAWHPTRGFHMLRGEAIVWAYAMPLLDAIFTLQQELLTTSTLDLLDGNNSSLAFNHSNSRSNVNSLKLFLSLSLTLQVFIDLVCCCSRIDEQFIPRDWMICSH